MSNLPKVIRVMEDSFKPRWSDFRVCGLNHQPFCLWTHLPLQGRNVRTWSAVKCAVQDRPRPSASASGHTSWSSQDSRLHSSSWLGPKGHLLSRQRRSPLARRQLPPTCTHLAFQPRAHACRTATSSVSPGTLAW